MRIVSVLLVIGSGLLSTAYAFGQTPDGQTPANEGVCDELIGLTPGLYGLCVAYCEAQDVDLLDPADSLLFREAPSQNILDNYRKKMGPGDPDMPCLKAPCPCWTQQELDEALYPMGGNQDACSKDVTNSTFTNLDRWSVGQLDSPSIDFFAIATQEAGIFFEGHRCGLTDLKCTDLSDPQTCTRLKQTIFSGITDEEFETCEAQLNQAGADRGFDCFIE